MYCSCPSLSPTFRVQEHARLLKRFEALKYSGEARTTGNQRMLSEFEAHLRESEAKAAQAQSTSERLTKILVNLQTGIEALHEKLGTIKPVQFRAASTVQDKLLESSLRLKKLHEELEARKSELPGGLEPDSIPRVLPEHNTRIHLDVSLEQGESTAGRLAERPMDEQRVGVGSQRSTAAEEKHALAFDRLLCVLVLCVSPLYFCVITPNSFLSA